MVFESIRNWEFFPSMTSSTAIPVSSQDVSMPKIRIAFFYPFSLQSSIFEIQYGGVLFEKLLACGGFSKRPRASHDTVSPCPEGTVKRANPPKRKAVCVLVPSSSLVRTSGFHPGNQGFESPWDRPMSVAYLTAAKAADLDTPRGRFFYRMFEILPGAIAWSTLLLAFLVSWLFPALAAFFILGFVLYWFLRTVYFAFHLRAGYRRTREHEKANWLQRVKKIEGWEGIYHLVLVPTYREPLEILRETFAALRSSDYPKDKMMVVLGIEEREGEEGARKARALEREFGGD